MTVSRKKSSGKRASIRTNEKDEGSAFVFFVLAFIRLIDANPVSKSADGCRDKSALTSHIRSADVLLHRTAHCE